MINATDLSAAVTDFETACNALITMKTAPTTVTFAVARTAFTAVNATRNVLNEAMEAFISDATTQASTLA